MSTQVPKNGYQTATNIQTNLPPLDARTKSIATKKWLTQNFGINKKIESKTDQSKYTKNELVEPIRIWNSVNKHSDAI